MCEDNCVMIVNANVQGAAQKVITLQDNGDSALENADSGTGTGDSDATVEADEILDWRTENDNLEAKQPVTITEQGPNSGVFGTYDESDKSVLKITSNAKRGTSASVDYNETPTTVLVGFDFATIDIQPLTDEWSSGEEIPVILVDGDANKNSRADEDLDVNNPDVDLIPSLKTGNPFTLGSGSSVDVVFYQQETTFDGATTITESSADPIAAWTGTDEVAGVGDVYNEKSVTVQAFSDRGIVTPEDETGVDAMLVHYDGATIGDLQNSIGNTKDGATGELFGFNLLNIDLRTIDADGKFDVYLIYGTIDDDLDQIAVASTTAIPLKESVDPQSLTLLNDNVVENIFDVTTTSDEVALLFLTQGDSDIVLDDATNEVIIADFFSFGFTDDGVSTTERVANQIIRIEAEETGDNTSTFEGSLEYVMVNQINIQDIDTFTGITTIADDPSFIVIEDLTDEDAPRVSYNDLGADGVVTPVSDQEEAPSHSGVVSLDADSYKIADTVTITLEDLDLNVDSDLIDIFTVVSVDNDIKDAVGSAQTQDLSFGELGRLLDVTFDDIAWKDQGSGCTPGSDNDGLGATGFTLVETGQDTGIFTGDFQIPSNWCRNNTDSDGETTTGLDIEVNYVDFRDASGEIVEVGDSAGVRANTGSVSLDRTVYPVPFGVRADFPTSGSNDADAANPNGRSIFPVHATGITDDIDTAGEELPVGDLTVHIRVNDPDFDENPSGEDAMDSANAVKLSVIRGSESVILGYAGAAVRDGLIDAGTKNSTINNIRSFGPIDEIAPDAGIFELDVTIRYTDGPASATCPNNSVYTALLDDRGTGTSARFDTGASYSGEDYCILQGDILQVEYTDPADASGDVNTVTDSATFDLRNGVLQSDKSVYIIGSDMILTLIEPDFDLDNDSAETYDLDLIEWDSDAATVTMGESSGGTQGHDSHTIEGYGIAFNVNENLSISYNNNEITYNRTSGNTDLSQEREGIALAYTMGSAAIKVQNNESKGSDSSATTTEERTEINLSLAF
jgi:hypothetical protein